MRRSFAVFLTGVPSAGFADATTQTITKDVVIIGGGAAGIFAATQVQSRGKSVAIVEKKAVFGGQTETYTIPGTNQTIDYGVEVYTPLVDGSFSVVNQFFGAYNLSTTSVRRSETGSGTTRYFDFTRGQELTNFTVNSNLSAYAAQANKYPYLGYQVQTPSPIPSDFVLPFGDFVTKYSLQNEVFNIFDNVQGLGDFLSLPSYYVLRELNSAHLLALSPSGPAPVVTIDHYNQEVYLRAQAKFGPNAIVNSTVSSARRTSLGVELQVKTPAGPLCIKASKLLIAVPPIPSNLLPFGPDSTESSLFSQFSYSGYYAALVNATGFPANQSYTNAVRDARYNLPSLPAVYSISTTSVGGIYLVRYGTQAAGSVSAIESDIVDTVTRIRAAAAAPQRANLPPVTLLAFANHQPYNLHVGGEALAGGFNNRLGALQGRRSTWYSGAVWFGSSSSDIWNATNAVVASMLA